jgi:hypothetical protein
MWHILRKVDNINVMKNTNQNIFEIVQDNKLDFDFELRLKYARVSVFNKINHLV